MALHLWLLKPLLVTQEGHHQLPRCQIQGQFSTAVLLDLPAVNHSIHLDNPSVSATHPSSPPVPPGPSFLPSLRQCGCRTAARTHGLALRLTPRGAATRSRCPFPCRCSASPCPSPSVAHTYPLSLGLLTTTNHCLQAQGPRHRASTWSSGRTCHFSPYREPPRSEPDPPPPHPAHALACLVSLLKDPFIHLLLSTPNTWLGAMPPPSTITCSAHLGPRSPVSCRKDNRTHLTHGALP